MKSHAPTARPARRRVERARKKIIKKAQKRAKNNGSTRTRKEALRLIKLGYRVFPVDPCSKKPITKNGVYDATLNRKQVCQWFRDGTKRKIGLACGDDMQLVVLDCDVKSGVPGIANLVAYLEKHKIHVDTYMVETPSGGIHFYFWHPKSSALSNLNSEFLLGVDIKTDGGYVIAAGSPNYTRVGGRLREIQLLPDDLFKALRKAGNKKRRKGRAAKNRNGHGDVVEGKRNRTVFNTACALRNQGHGQDRVLDLMLRFNQTSCKPALSDREVERCVASAFNYDDTDSIVEATETELTDTDFANATVFVERYKGKIGYCKEFGWAAYDGAHWILGADSEAFEAAKETIITRLDELKSTAPDDQLALFKWLKRSQSAERLRGLLTVAKSDRALRLIPSDFDSDPLVLNLLNGTLDLRTGELHPHRAADFHSKIANVEFDPAAKCPIFRRVLRTAFSRDPKMLGYLRRFFGYCLTGSTAEQIFAFWLGLGANSKSTIAEVFRELLGDYAAVAPIEVFLARIRGTGPSPDIARLRATRFVLASETPENGKLAEGLIKSLTGGDTISARKLYRDPFEFSPQFKILIHGNRRLEIRGTDHAIWRRVHHVPFDVQIAQAKQDHFLPEKLRSELPGILNLALQGCLKWQQYGLRPPSKVLRATNRYRSEMDIVGQFLRDCTKKKEETRARANDLYSTYSQWCEENGEHAVSQNKFGAALSERGYKRTRDNRGNIYVGLHLVRR